MCLGILVSTVSKDEIQAMQLALSLFFPSLLLSGVMWPVEAIPPGLQHLSETFPTTWSAEAMRSVLVRGWGLEWTAVWGALMVDVAWSAFFLLLSSFFIRRMS